jgi:hypothetical protein
VWQVLNTANYDLQAHPARPALAVIPAPPRTAAPGLGRSQPVELPSEEVRALGGSAAFPPAKASS